MSYWAIQITRKSHCKEILSAKVVDTNTMEICNLSGVELYTHCKYGTRIENLTIQNDKVVLCNYSKEYNTKIYFYRQRIIDFLKESFVIVTRGYKAIYEFLIDNPCNENKAFKFIGSVDDVDTYLDNIIGLDWSEFAIFNGVVLEQKYANKDGMNKIKCTDNINTYDNDFKNIANIRNNLKCWDCVLTEKNNKVALAFIRFNEDKVEIPEGINHFGKSFGGAKYIKMPQTLNSISENAFIEDNDLRILEIRSNIEKIHKEMFYEKDIKRLITKDIHINTIEKAAFKDCIYLNNVIDISVGDIQEFAFYYTSIEGAKIENCKHIGRKAFAMCEKLKILLATDTEIVDECAFAGCTKLHTVNLKYVKKIGKNAFSRCKNLKSVIINKDAIVEQDAFPKNVKITYV